MDLVKSTKKKVEMKKSVTKWTLIILTMLGFLNWGCNQDNISLSRPNSKNIRISFEIGKNSISNRGCALCYLKNRYQWNFLYRMLKESTDIEFIVYCPDEIKNDIKQDLFFDAVFPAKKIPQDNVFTVYKQGKVAYQKIGSLDMSSIRRITDMVVDLGF